MFCERKGRSLTQILKLKLKKKSTEIQNNKKKFQ